MKCAGLYIVVAMILSGCSVTRETTVQGTSIRDTTIIVQPPPIMETIPANPEQIVDVPTWIGIQDNMRTRFTLDMQAMLARVKAEDRKAYDSLLRVALSTAKGSFRVEVTPPPVDIRYRDTTLYRDRETVRDVSTWEKIGWAAGGGIVILLVAGAAVFGIQRLGK